MTVAVMLETKTTSAGKAMPTNVSTGRTFQITVEGKGPCAATVKLEYSNDTKVWFTVPDSPKQALSVGAANTYTVGGAIFEPFNEGWAYMRAECTAISGTDAKCTVIMSIM